MAIKLLAKPIRQKELENLKTECELTKKQGVIPNLQVLLVGNNPASLTYTRKKKKFMEKFGAKCDIIHLDESITKENFLSELKKITSDKNVHGAFVQLPLPTHLEDLEVEKLIPPEKDVDGFHPENIFNLLINEKSKSYFRPCTPYGIMTLFKHYEIDVAGKNVVIIGRSMIVGKPMGMLLTNANATVTLCHSRTKDIRKITKEADIVISAIGKAKYLDDSYFDPNKKDQTVVVDVGINYDEEGKICGDVDFLKVEPLVKAITPVPGGVGPLTILTLSQNLLQAAKNCL